MQQVKDGRRCAERAVDMQTISGGRQWIQSWETEPTD